MQGAFRLYDLLPAPFRPKIRCDRAFCVFEVNDDLHARHRLVLGQLIVTISDRGAWAQDLEHRPGVHDHRRLFGVKFGGAAKHGDVRMQVRGVLGRHPDRAALGCGAAPFGQLVAEAASDARGDDRMPQPSPAHRVQDPVDQFDAHIGGGARHGPRLGHGQDGCYVLNGRHPASIGYTYICRANFERGLVCDPFTGHNAVGTIVAGKSKRTQKSKKKSGGGASSIRSQADKLRRTLIKAESDAVSADALARAARLSGQLRKDGQYEAGLRLAIAGRRATARLCAEEALCALALGHRTQATAAAGAHPTVQKLIAPMLAVLGDAKPLNAPRGSTPAQKGLYAVARSLARLRDGDPDKALSSLNAAKAYERRLGPDGLRVAYLLRKPGTAERAVEDFRSTDLGRHRGACTATLRAAARRNPQVVLDTQMHPGMTAESEKLIDMDIAHGMLGPAATPGAIMTVAATFGARIFMPEDEARGWLYSGFGAPSDQPELAEFGFAQAASRGADPGEVLRGRSLVPQMASFFEDPSPKLADTCHRLAGYIATDPHGGPLAALALSIATARYLDIEHVAGATAALREAQALVAKLPRPVPSLDLQVQLSAIRVKALDTPAAAVEQLEAFIVTDPTRLEAWELRLRLAHEGGEGVAEVLTRAFEATGNQRFERELERVSVTKKKAVAGSSGSLAAQFRDALGGSPTFKACERAWNGVRAARARLGPTDRADLDAASVGLVGTRAGEDVLGRFLLKLGADPLTEASWPNILLICSGFELNDVQRLVEPSSSALRGHAPDIISQVLKSVFPADPNLGASLLARLHDCMPASELRTIRKHMDRPPRGWDLIVNTLLDDLHDRLEPEFCFVADVLEYDELAVPDDDMDAALGSVSAIISEITATPGGPDFLEIAKKLDAQRLRRIIKDPKLAKKIAKLMQEDPNPKSRRLLAEYAAKAKVTVDDIFDALSTPIL